MQGGKVKIPRHKLSEFFFFFFFFLTLRIQCPPCDFFTSKDGFVIERLQKMMFCLSFLRVSPGLIQLSKISTFLHLTLHFKSYRFQW